MDLTTGETIGAILPGLATGLGGVVLLFFRRDPDERTLDAMTGLTAGIMLAAAIFSLLIPALDQGSLGEVVVGLVAGVGFLAVLDEVVPHIHARFTEPGHPDDPNAPAQRRAILMLSALTIHNIPEGMAVGLAFAAGGTDVGTATAIAIGVQNIPEGFAAAAPLVASGTSKRRALAFSVATGAVEPPVALLAAAAVGVIGALIAGGLAFAAGAMLYVVIDELVPESYGHGNERVATLGFTTGFVIMLVLDNALV
jgi:zinc transporter, ZIP family